MYYRNFLQDFTMDKTLEHAWDEMTENFFKKKGIDFELLN